MRVERAGLANYGMNKSDNINLNKTPLAFRSVELELVGEEFSSNPAIKQFGQNFIKKLTENPLLQTVLSRFEGKVLIQNKIAENGSVTRLFGAPKYALKGKASMTITNYLGYAKVGNLSMPRSILDMSEKETSKFGTQLAKKINDVHEKVI